MIKKLINTTAAELGSLWENDSNVSNTFDNLQNDVDRIRVTIKLLEKNKLSKIVNDFNSIPKNNFKSQTFLKDGNTLYNNKDLKEAIIQYNKSLCFAEKDSKNLCFSYANRSAIYFQWGNYYKCLENIELAKKNNYPANLIDKILKRELKCKEKIQAQIKEIHIERAIPKLSYKAHKDVPFIAECLELDEDLKYGRYIKTNKDLIPGDVVAIEESFCNVRVNSCKYKRCAFCLEESLYSLIPCENCTSTMFCDQTCYQKSLQQFHLLECSIIDLLETFLDESDFYGVKLVLTLFSNQNILPDLKKFVNETDKNNVNVFTIDNTNTDILNKYKGIHTLNTNRQKRSKCDLMKKFIIVGIIYMAATKNSTLKTIFQTIEYDTLFINMLFHSIQIKDNMLPLRCLNICSDFLYGYGYFAFSGLLNHSCEPNLYRVLYKSKIVIHVIRPIRKGHQLFSNYRWTHINHDRNDRHKSLSRYYFTCNCIACLKNFPTLIKNLEEMHRVGIPMIVPKTVFFMNINSNTFSKDMINNYCEFLLAFDENYPCAQLIFVQETLKVCWDRKFNPPLKKIVKRIKYNTRI